MNNPYELIKSEEANFKTTPVQVVDGYEWQMSEHIQRTILYKNSQLQTGKDDNKPVKNITRPILNLQYRATGFDVKDIVIYVNDHLKYYKSFLLKKYHDSVWAKENKIDTFIDELVESYVDFGGVLVKKTNKSVRPEVVPWQRVAFCDQTDVLSGPICEKHYYSPDQLREMTEIGWENVEELIALSQNEKTEVQSSGKVNKTPGKYIEVYELHAVLPESCLNDGESEYEESKYVRQLHVVSFYSSLDGKKQWITLFKGKEKNHPYKFLARDAIYGRALGMGGAEELFEAQVWTNYNEIQRKNLLDAASKIIFKTTDQSYQNRNKIRDMENLEITVVGQGMDISQLDTYPRNIALFEKSANDWEEHGRTMGSANEAIMGEQLASGTPFKSVEFQAAENHSLHEYRKGKIATFVEELYREWFIPDMGRSIVSGTRFLSELDLEELQEIADKLAKKKVNDLVKERILNGELISQDELDVIKEQTREQFMSGGNKRFVEILKDEMKGLNVDVSINIVGKQKYLSAMTDKLVNIMRFVIASPQVLNDPRMAKIFNQILESSGFSPIDYGGYKPPAVEQVGGKSSPPLELPGGMGGQKVASELLTQNT